jgi:hypothetical protein
MNITINGKNKVTSENFLSFADIIQLGNINTDEVTITYYNKALSLSGHLVKGQFVRIDEDMAFTAVVTNAA